MSVKINKIVEPTCQLYDYADNLIGDITSFLELNDVRIQIMDQKVKGYYIIWNGVRLEIDSDGRIANWPDGFYDTIDNQLDALCFPEERRKNI